MLKNKQEPKLDFTRNKLLQQIFKNYATTFSLTLDTEDFIDIKHLKKFRKYVWKDMRRQLSQIPLLYRKKQQWLKAIKEKSEEPQKVIFCGLLKTKEKLNFSKKPYRRDTVGSQDILLKRGINLRIYAAKVQ